MTAQPGGAAGNSPKSHPRPRARLWAAALALLTVQACSAAAAGASRVEADDSLLEQAATDERGAWVSAPFSNAAWIPLGPAGSVTVAHGLARVPTSIEVYISSTADDRTESATRTFSPAAGDVANLRDVDADALTVINRTQGQFYIRLRVQ